VEVADADDAVVHREGVVFPRVPEVAGLGEVVQGGFEVLLVAGGAPLRTIWITWASSVRRWAARRDLAKTAVRVTFPDRIDTIVLRSDPGEVEAAFYAGLNLAAGRLE
jgi:hypothetical protein